MTNNRDRVQIQTFGRQLLPKTGEFFLQSYLDATTSKKFGVLVVDHSIHQSDRWRLRNFLFVDPDKKSDLKFYVPLKKQDQTMSSIVRVIPETLYERLEQEGLLGENSKVQPLAAAEDRVSLTPSVEAQNEIGHPQIKRIKLPVGYI